MRRRLSAGLLAVALTAGCAGQQPVSPLPIEAAPAPTGPVPVAVSASPAGSPSASRRPTPSPRPSRSRKSSLPSTCQGAVMVTIDTLDDELALVPSLCLGVGAVLRITSVVPGDVDTTPERLVDGHYEGGVVDIRFIRRGTVVVTIRENGKKYRIPVVVR